ncbi:MAG TPA: Rrf2 family transcriptional regulator [Candidatus Omnitrophota bacterium]|nr:Rrf2 family transcriptional regulator [Candidatus Omnitrophota bacterium]HSA30517.1 Rrf2 family transcriptional regulator [Candidatus Omnitrophota bacterium]
MKLTYKGDYALKAVLDLAIHYGKELVTSHDLARRVDAPVKFFEQVLMELKKGGIIDSRRGKEGGYLLSKAPSQITVGDVVRIIDGPIEPIACVKDRYRNCQDIDRCVFRNVWQKVHQATSDIIDHVTFEELVSQVKAGQDTPTYSI